MKTLETVSIALMTAALAFSVTACKKKEEAAVPTASVPAPAPAPAAAPDLVNVPVSVKRIVLSNKVDAVTKQAVAMTAFGVNDTIYAVVDTIGSGKTSIKTLWTYHKGDKTAQVNETAQDIDAAGPASTEFRISKPSGWPTGDYQVEVFLNGMSSGVQKFVVN